MLRIKICGITCVEDALLAAEAGADAIGLNFYPPSPRFVDRQRAAEIIAALPAGVTKVGLFVNAAADEMCRASDALGLDLIQLHGDEPPELIAQLGRLPAMKVFRLGQGQSSRIAEYLAACEALSCGPRLVLLDALVEGQFGGTGRRADWAAAAAYCSAPAGVGSRPPLILAGGLTPANVAAAIRAARPHGVDVASGVEASPGRKDPALVRAFVTQAQAAFPDL